MPDIMNFKDFFLPVDTWISALVDWLVTNFRPQFQLIKLPVDITLTGIDNFLNWLPPIVVLLFIILFAWKFSGKAVAIFSLISFLLIGYMGLWSETMTTLAMVFSSVIFCVVVGIPLGIIASRSDGFAAGIRPVLDTMQTTPAFVYLVPVVMLFSIGTVAGVIATIVFSMPPIIRLTNLGIRQVHPELIEAALAFGSTPRQVLLKVQVPLALPTIMAGLNQTIMLSLSMVVIAALIGAGGLGVPVFQGLNSLQVGLAGIGGISIVLMAMVLDRITQSLGNLGKR